MALIIAEYPVSQWLDFYPYSHNHVPGVPRDWVTNSPRQGLVPFILERSSCIDYDKQHRILGWL